MKNKVDRLFWDKLARHKVNPTENAWEQVKSKLDRQSHQKLWLGIAASVIILAMSTILVLKSSENLQTESSPNFLVDHPSPIAAFEWDLSEIEDVPKEKISEGENKKLGESNDAKPLVGEMFASMELPKDIEQEITDFPANEKLPLLAPLELTTTVVIEESIEPILDDELAMLPQLRVQITYKADEEPSALKEDKTRVGKLLAKARQIKPGEMLASIRETKNDFFNGKKN